MSIGSARAHAVRDAGGARSVELRAVHMSGVALARAARGLGPVGVRAASCCSSAERQRGTAGGDVDEGFAFGHSFSIQVQSAISELSSRNRINSHGVEIPVFRYCNPNDRTHSAHRKRETNAAGDVQQSAHPQQAH